MVNELKGRVFAERLKDLQEMPKELIQELSSGVEKQWTKIFLTEPDPEKWPPKMCEILKPYMEQGSEEKSG
ncbi:MAG: hypothetical protein V1736_04715 [Pseudomonadota bacterium]